MGRLEMGLTPQHVQEKQFHDAFRGYNHEEVDRFLDEVAEAFAAAYKERDECRFRIQELESDLERARSTEEILKRTLLHANQAAEEAIRQARATSGKIVAESERKANEIVTDAKRRTQGIVERAQSEVRELEERADELRRFEHDYRAQLRAFLDSQLRALSGRAIHSQRRPGATGAHPRSDGGLSVPQKLVELRSEEAPTAERIHAAMESDMEVEEVHSDMEVALEPMEAEDAGLGVVAETDAGEGPTAESEGTETGAGDVSGSEKQGAVAPQQELQ